MSVGPHAEKFNIVTTMDARKKCDFSVLDRKYPFRASLVQKIKIISVSWNLGSRLIRISRIQLWSSLFLVLTGNTLYGQNWLQNSKLFKVKFAIKTNSNVWNWMMMFSFSVFDLKYPYWPNLVQKIKIISLKAEIRICRI